jgi:DnaJ-class molecular chaperone
MSVIMCSTCRCCSLDNKGVCVGDCEMDGHTVDSLCDACNASGRVTGEVDDEFLGLIAFSKPCEACGGDGIL